MMPRSVRLVCVVMQGVCVESGVVAISGLEGLSTLAR